MRIIDEFKEFALKGNVIDLAVGIIIGTEFNKIVNSLVADVIMPPIGALVGNVNFSNLYINLSPTNYDNLASAAAAGAPVVKYGLFINNTISFFITAWAVFILVKTINLLRRREQHSVL